MVDSTLLQSLIVSLVGFLIVGAGAFMMMALTKISKKEFQDAQDKQETQFDKKLISIEQRMDKERLEMEKLFSKEILLVKQQLEFVISGISDIKESVKENRK